MIPVSIVATICSPCGTKQHALITTSSLPCRAGLEWTELFKFPVCPMRVGALCLLNLCFKNVTFDSCAALSHPIAHIRRGPVCWGFMKDVSVITSACTALCTSLTPRTLQQSPPTSSVDHFLCSSKQQHVVCFLVLSTVFCLFWHLLNDLEEV